ncbi:MAG: hypothetical protein OEL76_10255 [Siculibacillus sp.]|nr:hypothetical protein [Siculibacillus sp.]
MTTVALVGLGNIGFRHLQGLASIRDRIELIGIDPSPAAVERARGEWERQGGRGRFASSLDALDEAEVLILATPSRGRLDQMNLLLPRLRPKAAVLEKVVFTRRGDFEAATALAAESGTEIRVNCPCRMWPVYRDLAGRLAGVDGPIRLSIADPDLGLACNGVHNVDVFQFLVGDRAIRAVEVDLGDVFESKRPGYFEVHGRFEIVTERGDRLSLAVRGDDAPGRRIRLETPIGVTDVDQFAGTHALGGEPVAFGRPPYQSELTGTVVADLLDHGRCGLPSLATSALAHGIFIDALTPHFEAAGIDCRDGLPIT